MTQVKETPLFVTWGKTPPMLCPRCQQTLYSATGLSWDHPARPKNGDLTLCDQCFTWLAFVAYVFPSPSLALRLATAAEIATIDAEQRALVEGLAATIATRAPKQ